MVRLQLVNGFAAAATSAAIIGLASYCGIPVSTTHNVSAAIMVVGAAKRLNALKWTVVELDSDAADLGDDCLLADADADADGAGLCWLRASMVS